jgi:hypothetical protein
VLIAPAELIGTGLAARKPVLSPNRRVVGLYERLLEEQVEEEQRQDGQMPTMRGLASQVLVKRLVNDPRDRLKYAADLSMMHRLMTRGPCNVGEGMKVENLKAKYRKEYGELRVERRGQQELL